MSLALAFRRALGTLAVGRSGIVGGAKRFFSVGEELKSAPSKVSVCM